MYSKISKPNIYTLNEFLANSPEGWLHGYRLEKIELRMKGYTFNVVSENKLSQEQDFLEFDET